MPRLIYDNRISRNAAVSACAKQMNTRYWSQPWRKRAKRAQRKAIKSICTSRGKQSVMANGEPRALNRLRVASNAFDKAKRAVYRYANDEAVARLRLAK